MRPCLKLSNRISVLEFDPSNKSVNPTLLRRRTRQNTWTLHWSLSILRGFFCGLDWGTVQKSWMCFIYTVASTSELCIWPRSWSSEWALLRQSQLDAGGLRWKVNYKGFCPDSQVESSVEEIMMKEKNHSSWPSLFLRTQMGTLLLLLTGVCI